MIGYGTLVWFLQQSFASQVKQHGLDLLAAYDSMFMVDTSKLRAKIVAMPASEAVRYLADILEGKATL